LSSLPVSTKFAIILNLKQVYEFLTPKNPLLYYGPERSLRRLNEQNNVKYVNL